MAKENRCNLTRLSLKPRSGFLYSHKKFILNNKDVVLCDGIDEIYFRMVSETKTPENHTTAQIIEIFSFVLEMVELRNILDDIGNGRCK